MRKLYFLLNIVISLTLAISMAGISRNHIKNLVFPANNSAPFSFVVSTYTLDADFDRGKLININHNAPNNNQLQMNANLTTFPFIWVAISGRGTIAKIDTVNGNILGEYYSAPQGRGRNPSRTTVDMYGNVWVGNRDENDADTGSVTHVGLLENSQCVDRNGNGKIDTSAGLGDVRPWSNSNGVDNQGGVQSAEDECIIHYVRAGSGGTRHVAVDQNNHVWVSGIKQSGRLFAEIDGDTGKILQTVGPFSCGGYGGLFDRNGVLWSTMNDDNGLLRFDPASGKSECVPVKRAYGIAVDNQGVIWFSQLETENLTRVQMDGTVLNTLSTGSCGSRGVAVSADDSIWTANSCDHSVSHLKNSGELIAKIPVGNQPTGVAVDSKGKVWVTNLESNNAMRIDPATNQVDLTVDLGAGAGPYNYSDMTGIVLMRNTAPQGTWTVIHDGGETGAKWGAISWQAQEANGSRIFVRARSADSSTDLGSLTYVDVQNNIANTQIPPGRFLQIEVRFIPGMNETSPILYDLSIYGDQSIIGGYLPLTVILVLLLGGTIFMMTMKQIIQQRRKKLIPLTDKSHARLVGISGLVEGRTYPLSDGFLIGRARNSSLYLSEPSVSRQHARIRLGNAEWYLQDMNSDGGTYVNGVRIAAHKLQHGDRVRIGTTEMEFRL